MTSENFFAAIEASRGENLSSAVLAYLLRNDSKLLSAFDLASDLKLDFETNIKVEPEAVTNSAEYGEGRLDILIELSESLVIGLENKIWHPFGKKQPVKYCETLLSRARAIGDAKAILLVLAPLARGPEAEKRLAICRTEFLAENIQFSFVSWEELLERLERVAKSGTFSSYLIQQLRDFIDRQLNFDKPFEEVHQELYKSSDRWNRYQDELVKKIWHLFPDQGLRIEIAQGKYIGYRFYRNWNPPDRPYVYGWFGFVNPESHLGHPALGEPREKVEFVIASNLRIDQLPSQYRSHFIPVDFPERHWPEKCSGWIVKISKDWNSEKYWRDLLLPLVELFDQALPDGGYDD